MLENQGDVSLTVDGREIPFIFNMRDGGEADSNEEKTFPGGGRAQKAQGGSQIVSNVTIGFEYDPETQEEFYDFLKNRRGRGNVVVTEVGLDDENNAFGRPSTWRGKLKKIARGKYDANSDSTRMGEIEVSTHGDGG